MKKNGEFVGVDEKFIPEDEKYVDESVIGNKEQSKETLKKVGNIGKKVGIGYLVFVGIILAFVIGGFIFVFSMFAKTNDVIDDMKNNANGIINNANGVIGDITNKLEQSQKEQEEMYEDTKENVEEGKQEIESEQQEATAQIFNSKFKIYAGNMPKIFVGKLIDTIYANNNENARKIDVRFNGETITDNSVIKGIASKLEKEQYYISFEYDDSGYAKTAIID